MGVKEYCKSQNTKFIPQHLHQGFIDTYVRFYVQSMSAFELCINYVFAGNRYDAKSKGKATELTRSMKQLIDQISDTTNLWSLMSLLSGQYCPALFRRSCKSGAVKWNFWATRNNRMQLMFHESFHNAQMSKSTQPCLPMLLARVFSGKLKS